VPLPTLFDYTVPANLTLTVGDRVVVPFGARQRLGVVLEIDSASDLPLRRMRAIAAVRDDAPRLPPDWIDLMRFLSGYYQRPLGETVIGSLPPRLRSVKPLPRKALSASDTHAPHSNTPHAFVPNHPPTQQQHETIERIAASLGSFKPFLLHGVTGSGKTEIYLHSIARVLQRGAQALVLIPEISLTPQLESHFRKAFPQTRLAVLHSGLQDVP
jgi:primosomal protein N' (replication factor Y)